MIECIFTLDYEVYGNGEGSLDELVLEPTAKLAEIFDREGVKFVNFVEALEFEQIAEHAADPSIAEVCEQIGELYRNGHEIGLHLHPQWAGARFEDGRFVLDYNEYNLCILAPERIEAIVDRAIRFLRRTTNDPDYVPFSFRAGNWLFQPSRDAAAVLAERGVKVDSSVFKGGRIHQHDLDYRASIDNGYHWRFEDDVNVAEAGGRMLEVPIHTRMVPPWRLPTSKRIRLQKKTRTSNGASRVANRRPQASDLARLLDYARPLYPLKFDFCRMTFGEITSMLELEAEEDLRDPGTYRPLVAIGHSKDLDDLDTVARCIEWLKRKGIAIATLESAYSRCASD